MMTEFQKGYKNGFADGNSEGYAVAEAEVIQKVKDFLDEEKDLSEGAKDIVRKYLNTIHPEE